MGIVMLRDENDRVNVVVRNHDRFKASAFVNVPGIPCQYSDAAGIRSSFGVIFKDRGFDNFIFVVNIVVIYCGAVVFFKALVA